MSNYETAKIEFRDARNDFINAYKVYLEKLIALFDRQIEQTNNMNAKNNLVDLMNDVIKTKESALETATGQSLRPYYTKSTTSESLSALNRPLVFGLSKSDKDNGNIIAAYYTYRYHNAEFRAMFQGDNNANSSNNNNNSSVCLMHRVAQDCLTKKSGGDMITETCCMESFIDTCKTTEWFCALAKAAITIIKSVAEKDIQIPDEKTTSTEQFDLISLFGAHFNGTMRRNVEVVYQKMTTAGFRPDFHPKLWSSAAELPMDNSEKFFKDPKLIFDSIPRAHDLPDDLKRETQVLLACFDILASYYSNST